MGIFVQYNSLLVLIFIDMQNIEIKRNKNKRSIQSLIEESAIDNSFNYEAHELRKAFNQTLLTMNAKNTEREKEIEKLKIVVKEYQENTIKYELKIKKLTEDWTNKNHLFQQLSQQYTEMKKRLQYLEYKFENISQNRNLFEQSEDQNYEEQRESNNKKKLKSEIYNEIGLIISRKVQYFTTEIKKLTMSFDVESRIQSFLQELIYLNPYSQFHILEQLRNDKRQNQGKIRKDNHEDITEQDQWKMLQKSLQKLKEVKRRNPVEKTQNQSKEYRDRSVSKRKKLFG